MKAGYWTAPDDSDDLPISILPIGGDGIDNADGRSDHGSLAFLATADAATMIERCPGVAALLPKIVDALRHQTADAPGLLFDLGSGLGDEEVRLMGEVLGEGEVAATVALPDGVIAHIEESRFAGLWRVRFADADGKLVADYAEVSTVPQAVRRAAAMTVPAAGISTPPDGAMNVMPVLSEITDRAAGWMAGVPAHVISLSLLPMSEADMAFLAETLGTGPVRVVSRGYGTCRVQATAVRNVWSVQFFNAADAVLLDSIEIGDVPEVVVAAEEDMRDSAVRLSEIEEAYFK